MNDQWSISGEYIIDGEGLPRFRVMGSAPYNQEWMQKVVTAVNENETLCEVAVSAKWLKRIVEYQFGESLRGAHRKEWEKCQAAFEKLEAIKKAGAK